jgi:hypothetical protein
MRICRLAKDPLVREIWFAPDSPYRLDAIQVQMVRLKRSYSAAVAFQQVTRPAAAGSVRQADAHDFNPVNFAASELEDFSALQVGGAAVRGGRSSEPVQ